MHNPTLSNLTLKKVVAKKWGTAERQRVGSVHLSSPATISLCPAFLSSTSGSDSSHWASRWTNRSLFTASTVKHDKPKIANVILQRATFKWTLG